MFHYYTIKGEYSHFPDFELRAVRMPKVHVFGQTCRGQKYVSHCNFPFEHPLHFFSLNIAFLGSFLLNIKKSRKLNMHTESKGLLLHSIESMKKRENRWKNPNLNHPMFFFVSEFYILYDV